MDHGSPLQLSGALVPHHYQRFCVLSGLRSLGAILSDSLYIRLHRTTRSPIDLLQVHTCRLTCRHTSAPMHVSTHMHPAVFRLATFQTGISLRIHVNWHSASHTRDLTRALHTRQFAFRLGSHTLALTRISHTCQLAFASHTR